MKRAKVGIFGGSGFYKFLKEYEELDVQTPYGAPSASLKLSSIGSHAVAFLPRHGEHHQFPPHMVPYRANLSAFSQVGVERVIGPCAVGSLDPRRKPGEFVICDQFVHFTTGRKDTFYDGPETTHISTADPYCPELRKIASESAGRLGIPFHSGGTVVVIQGPALLDEVGEPVLQGAGMGRDQHDAVPGGRAREELEMCYVNISLVTDYDSGLEGDPSVKPVSHEGVIKIFNQNLENLRKLIMDMVGEIPEKRSCACGTALENARLKA